jgi:hypothetical protein
MSKQKLLVAALLAVLAAACIAGSAAAKAPPGFNAAQFDATAKAKFTTDTGAEPFRTSKTIPYWGSSFTDPTNGVTYPYTMVGTNPYGAPVTTTVPSEIIPFKFNFSDGTVMDGTADVSKTIASPIFSNYAHSLSGGDFTQTGDAIYRAQWNKSSSGYHVRLGTPTVYPTQTFDVPANQGFTFVNSRGVQIGLMSYSWFSSRLKNTINTLGIDPTTLPVILTHNTMLYIGTTDNCCIIGYHGATGSAHGNGAQSVQTYMFAAYSTPRTFGGFPTVGISDIHALSHEVSEWYDDPFVNNFVNPWLTPTAPQYGCTAYLETGDPVVGIWFPLAGNTYDANAGGVWHPEDEVHFSWFARETPSRAYGGYYTYMNTFHEAAHGC